MRKSGILDRLIDLLLTVDIEYAIYKNVEVDPLVKTIDN